MDRPVRPQRRARSNSESIRYSSRLQTSNKSPKKSPSPKAGEKRSFEHQTNDVLMASLPATGKLTTVHIKVNGSRIGNPVNFPTQEPRRARASLHRKVRSLSDSYAHTQKEGMPIVSNSLGDDGNQYYCNQCREVGDVVCCDGCPRVYHPWCIPENDPSRISLDADDDPWFCPLCMKEGQTTTSSKKVSSSMITDNIQKGPQDAIDQRSSRFKNVCLAEMVVDDQEEERRIEAVNAKEEAKAEIKARKNNAILEQGKHGYTSESSMEEPMPITAGTNSMNNMNVRSTSKSSGLSPLSRGRGRPKGSTNKTPKKIRKENDGIDGSDNPFKPSQAPPTPDEEAPASNRRLPEKATSPFFFFLMENRIRLERQISRKNRSYKRMKGYQRNLLLSKEGAMTWAKASQLEKKKYIDMSLQEFEYNVLAWKEEETLREMMTNQPDLAQETMQGTEGAHLNANDLTPRDHEYWEKKCNSLIARSQVHCRRIRSGPESIQNTVLLELLQDSRFHSLPMVKANRDCRFELEDHSMTAVPHFNVQGPISTSIGDGCLGCIRGWNHFCPIVKRQLPAVEHRAKLQPPCPSHLPVRIGIGLPTSLTKGSKKFSYNDKKTYKDLRFLSQPNTRGDEILKLVNTAMAVKLPAFKESEQSQSTFTSKRKRSSSYNNGNQELYECGRCKIPTISKWGCVTCRRVKLLVDISKTSPTEHDNLVVQTVMLGRGNTKTDEFHFQTEGEKRIAQGMVKRPFKPNAILPQLKKTVPPKYPTVKELDSSSADETDSYSISSSETETNKSESDDEMENSLTTEQSEDVDASEDTPPKRRRLTRSAISKNNEEITKNESNRQAMAEVHKEEANLVSSRCLSIATCGILLAMIRRDPLRLFAEPVPFHVEGYHKIIKKPIDLGTMKEKVLKGKYSSLGSFISDARLLCINSLVYNPPGTIYSMTAEEIQGILGAMQKRAAKWMYAIKNAHSSHYARTQKQANLNFNVRSTSKMNGSTNHELYSGDEDPFQELRRNWPGAVELFEDDGQWLRSQIESEFVRTRENEYAYYATIAVRRAALSAEASLSPIFESDKIFNPCTRRSHIDDEALRDFINKEVAEGSDLGQITAPPSWREQDVLELLKKVQKRRVETKISPEDGCARCDKISIDDEGNKLARETSVIRRRKRNDGVQVRIAESRRSQSNGMASKRERDRVKNSRTDTMKAIEAKSASARDRSVTVRGSTIQGWGLFADHPFRKGELVAEYVGEYVVNPMADKREKFYEERRIQDYQFRVGATLVIDATKLGGHARYINHSCEPNCVAKIIDGEPPNQHLKRVVVISQRDILAGEEITYDYQFPLELDLDARIPCNCGSKSCRGFMNWDLPESGSLVARASTRQGRRDRIRRLVNKAL